MSSLTARPNTPENEHPENVTAASPIIFNKVYS